MVKSSGPLLESQREVATNPNVGEVPPPPALQDWTSPKKTRKFKACSHNDSSLLFYLSWSSNELKLMCRCNHRAFCSLSYLLSHRSTHEKQICKIASSIKYLFSTHNVSIQAPLIQLHWRIQREAQQARAPSRFWSTVFFYIQFCVRMLQNIRLRQHKRASKSLWLLEPSSGPLDPGRKGLRVSCVHKFCAPSIWKFWIRPCTVADPGGGAPDARP